MFAMGKALYKAFYMHYISFNSHKNLRQVPL